MLFRRRTLFWPIGICIALFALSLFRPTRDLMIRVFGPEVRIVRLAGQSIGNSVKVVTSIPTLAKENGDLRAQINEYKALDITNTELKHENDLLRKELSLNAQSNNTLIAAEVISRTSSVSQESVLVNKGSADGFSQGMAVMAQGFLIGRVAEVLPHSSKVALLTSPESIIPVVLQNSRAVGLLHGGPGGLTIQEIPGDVKVDPGEAVVSSNIGDTIKSGLPVGNVTTISSNKSDVFESAHVASPVDLSKLEVVFGVKP